MTLKAVTHIWWSQLEPDWFVIQRHMNSHRPEYKEIDLLWVYLPDTDDIPGFEMEIFFSFAATVFSGLDPSLVGDEPCS